MKSVSALAPPSPPAETPDTLRLAPVSGTVGQLFHLYFATDFL